MKTYIIMNEQHGLMGKQEVLLERQFQRGPDYKLDYIKVPATGWTREDMAEVFFQITEVAMQNEDETINVVFLSPIPYLLGRLVSTSAYAQGAAQEGKLYVNGLNIQVWAFHNDQREKKELPNGRVISVVAQEGWELLRLTPFGGSRVDCIDRR